ncbi:ribosomal RNA small subunit methyltransferase A [Patescibacteria group bacterium]|nr:ribosomal RNA small subunit methyltransferase A [Patescibacteria group bacterium]MBU4274345.1 ribosomal RNA small subunit methyltransferase A [Patescibacteria group bacterium]MBU4367547.1 ribosomal RNA small subunit methyltransferase A [Patescibacteria group bacterium]MBU4461588.1 ribosomal RNA small subunit methyltransferase A [Patescibacteria group bacterium]MCG2699485.1 16S rRNA (adenine(1518)-N(6)/adenine(1519)-N(6))-dimethyltransferase RsmA [Candidatus Parcubacteria bacterium]
MTKNIIRNTKNTLTRQKIKPSRGLGQNFLIDKTALKKIVRTADLKPSDIVLEIGPGTGILTQELIKRVKKVIAIEKDQKMAKVLKKGFSGFKNLEVISADILRIKNLKLTKEYKVVANLPYYITSPVIRKFLEHGVPPKLMVLMVQKEVAQRICAKPPKMNLLAVSVQFYGKPEIIDYISKQSFWPQPKVDSAILKISDIKKPRISADLFFKIARAGFSQPRKQLTNNLTKGLELNKEKILSWFLKNRINPKQRAENFFIKNWVALTKTFKAH